jgi:tight adherence protein C
MSTFDTLLHTLYVLLGLAGAGSAGYFLVKIILPDQALLAAQQRLGLESAVRNYKHYSLKMLSPIYRGLVPRIQQIKMPRWRSDMKRKFVAAGVDDQFDPDEFMGLKFVSSVIFLMLAFSFVLQLGKEMNLFYVSLSLLVGFYAPDFVIYDITNRRKKSILRQLPDMMDLMTLSVEAGLDFMAAIGRVVAYAKDGPLKDEFNQMLKELQLGVVRADALRNMADRVQLSELSSFATILIQADQMGASIGPVLRSQSDLLRMMRFQRAEREGAKATQKLLIPLVVCILPSVFIVIIGPMICDIYYNQPWLRNVFGG